MQMLNINFILLFLENNTTSKSSSGCFKHPSGALATRILNRPADTLKALEANILSYFRATVLSGRQLGPVPSISPDFLAHLGDRFNCRSFLEDGKREKCGGEGGRARQGEFMLKLDPIRMGKIGPGSTSVIYDNGHAGALPASLFFKLALVTLFLFFLHHSSL